MVELYSLNTTTTATFSVKSTATTASASASAANARAWPVCGSALLEAVPVVVSQRTWPPPRTTRHKQQHSGADSMLTPPDHHQTQNPSFLWYSYSMKASVYIIKVRCVGLALMSRTLFSYPPCLVSKLTPRWRTTDLQRQPKTAKCKKKCK